MSRAILDSFQYLFEESANLTHTQRNAHTHAHNLIMYGIIIFNCVPGTFEAVTII